MSWNLRSQSVTTHSSKDSIVTIPKNIAIKVLKDLNAYDGLKKEIIVYKQTDSLQQNRIHYKDSIIYTYQKQVINYDSLVNDLNFEKILLEKEKQIAINEYKIQKRKTIATQFVAAIIIITLLLIKH